MVDFVEELLKKYGFQLDIKTNLYQHEIYVDQNGTLSNEVVFDILCSNDPYMTLSEILDNLYIGYIQHLKSQMQKEVDIALGTLSSTNLTALEKRMYFIYPIEHYLQQKFKTNIIVNTGKDDFLWLLEQQGYTRKHLLFVKDNLFLNSLIDLIGDLWVLDCALTFLVEMTLKELIHLNILMKQKNSDNIVISSNTTAGFVDFWCGAGSDLEIKLEKDVIIPIKFIQSALPDGGYSDYSIEHIYLSSNYQAGSISI